MSLVDSHSSLTNNSSKTRTEYRHHLHNKFGLDVLKEEILTSGFAAALYLQSIKFYERKIYVIGSNSLRNELKDAGLKVFDEDHTKHEYHEEEMSKLKVDPEIGCVVIGYDKCINNFKFAYAHQVFQRNPDCLYIATNCDATLPYGDVFLPGTGASVNYFSTVVAKKPIVCGKPEPNLFRHLEQTHNVDLKRSIMIGDRLDTDIKMGVDANVLTALVLTGVTTMEQLQHTSHTPTYVLESLAVLKNE